MSTSPHSGAGPAEPKIRTPRGVLSLWFASFLAMAPWPLMGIMLLQSSFDEPQEAALLFGGITLFPLMVLAFIPTPEFVYVVVLILVWLAAAVVPGPWLRRRLTSWPRIAGLLTAQAGFSIAQAMMGALLIVGKSV